MEGDRFVSPCAPPEGRVRELLTVLVEECAEVQQRATKALRFGVEEVQPGQALSNAERLSMEIGDILVVVHMLISMRVLTADAIEDGRVNKRRQLAKFLQTPAPDAAR